MFLWLKRLSGAVSDGQWFSGRPTVSDLDLQRDWADMERLIAADGLHHTRADVAGWLAAEPSIGLVARKDDAFAGFMLAHAVGRAAHIDLVAVDPRLRRASIARPLYFRGVNALKVAGSKGFVAHAHPEPGALLQVLGYAAGDRYTLVENTVGEVTVAGGMRGELLDDDEIDLDQAAALDARVFGAERKAWLKHLLARDDTEVQGLRKKGELTALLVMQQTDKTRTVRLAAGAEFKDIASLLHTAMVMSSGRTIRCWVRSDSKLEKMLGSMEFTPAADSVPFTEYRLGSTDGIGTGDGVLQLSWW